MTLKGSVRFPHKCPSCSQQWLDVWIPSRRACRQGPSAILQAGVFPPLWDGSDAWAPLWNQSPQPISYCATRIKAGGGGFDQEVDRGRSGRDQLTSVHNDASTQVKHATDRRIPFDGHLCLRVKPVSHDPLSWNISSRSRLGWEFGTRHSVWRKGTTPRYAGTNPGEHL